MKKETIKIELNKKQRLALLDSVISCPYRYECLRELVCELGNYVKKENPNKFSKIMNMAIIKNHVGDYIVKGEDTSDE